MPPVSSTAQNFANGLLDEVVEGANRAIAAKDATEDAVALPVIVE